MTTKVPRELECELSDEEKLELGQKIGAALTEHDAKQEEKRKISADQKPIKALIRELQKKLKTGTEQRTLLCEVIEGPGANISFKRPDTGEVFGTRAMTPSEQQRKLGGDDSWLDQTEAAVAKAKAKRGAKGGRKAANDVDQGDDEPSNVVPFGAGRSASKKAARKPKGGGKKSKR